MGKTLIHVRVEREEGTRRMILPICVKFPGKAVIQRFDEVTIMGPSKLIRVADDTRVILETEARVVGRIKK